MIIKYEDKEYNFDLDEIDLQEARYLKKHAGLTVLQVQQGLLELDPDILAAVYWLMMKQNGVTVDLARVNFKLVKLTAAIVDSLEREAEAQEAQENPTETAQDKRPAPQIKND